jgi:hypothetical protein
MVATASIDANEWLRKQIKVLQTRTAGYRDEDYLDSRSSPRSCPRCPEARPKAHRDPR